MTWPARVRGAWGVLAGRLVAVPPSSLPPTPEPGRKVALAWPHGTGADDPMATAVALITEALDGGRIEVINALLCDVTQERLPLVAVAAVALASALGEELTEVDPAAAAAVLRRVGLNVADRPGVA